MTSLKTGLQTIVTVRWKDMLRFQHHVIADYHLKITQLIFFCKHFALIKLLI